MILVHNTIHAYGTLPPSKDLKKMLKTPSSHAEIAQLVEQLGLSVVIPGSSAAAASLFGPSRAKDLKTT
jgi:hypothetical protein